MDYVNIKDRESLIRDLDSKAILNTSMAAVDKYNQQRKIFDEAKTTKEEMTSIKQDINDLKIMFEALLRKINDTTIS